MEKKLGKEFRRRETTLSYNSLLYNRRPMPWCIRVYVRVHTFLYYKMGEKVYETSKRLFIYMIDVSGSCLRNRFLSLIQIPISYPLVLEVFFLQRIIHAKAERKFVLFMILRNYKVFQGSSHTCCWLNYNSVIVFSHENSSTESNWLS